MIRSRQMKEAFSYKKFHKKRKPNESRLSFIKKILYVWIILLLKFITLEKL